LNTVGLSAPPPTEKRKTASMFLRDVEANPQPSPYFDLIAAAKSSGTSTGKYGTCWLFGPRQPITWLRLSHEIMHEDAPISVALRELIAAYTSSLNRCEFCMKAHAAVAADLYNDEALVWSVIRDLEGAALPERDKAIFALCAVLHSTLDRSMKVTLPRCTQPDGTTHRSSTRLRRALFSTSTTASYPPTGSSLSPMRPSGALAARMAQKGYIRE
jgi:AhpD family alkylhydroperoxidase